MEELAAGDATKGGRPARTGDRLLIDYVLRRANGYFIYSTVEGVSFQPADVPVGPIEVVLVRRESFFFFFFFFVSFSSSLSCAHRTFSFLPQPLKKLNQPMIRALGTSSLASTLLSPARSRAPSAARLCRLPRVTLPKSKKASRLWDRSRRRSPRGGSWPTTRESRSFSRCRCCGSAKGESEEEVARGRGRRRESEKKRLFVQLTTEEPLLILALSPRFPFAFFKPSAMKTQSRAAVIPLLAGLALLCSATRAQVSVFFHWKYRYRIELKPRRQKPTTSFPRLWRKREGFPFHSLASFADTRRIRGGRRSVETKASL